MKDELRAMAARLDKLSESCDQATDLPAMLHNTAAALRVIMECLPKVRVTEGIKASA